MVSHRNPNLESPSPRCKTLVLFLLLLHLHLLLLHLHLLLLLLLHESLDRKVVTTLRSGWDRHSQVTTLLASRCASFEVTPTRNEELEAFPNSQSLWNSYKKGLSSRG